MVGGVTEGILAVVGNDTLTSKADGIPAGVTDGILASVTDDIQAAGVTDGILPGVPDCIVAGGSNGILTA